jgi:hypothetical protein
MLSASHAERRPGKAPTPATEALSAGKLAESIEAYLSEHPGAAVLEDGRELFDMRTARYAVSEQHGRCLLQLWSEERNLVRSVIGMQPRAGNLRLTTRRMGAPKPQMLELTPSSDRRTPSVRDAARRTYQRVLERALTRRFHGVKIDGLRSAMDLEHSFGPAYVRGWMLKGPAAQAVIGVSQTESGTTIDGVLTLGILWLGYCREKSDGRRHVGGLKVIVPTGAWRTTAQRMAWLNHDAAQFELWTLDERSEELEAVDFRDMGNLDSRLVHAFSAQAAIERCAESVTRLMGMIPEAGRERVEVRAASANEVSFNLHGLEFARVRRGFAAHSFAPADEITFGAGANETSLTDGTESLCRELLGRLFASRHPQGVHTDALFRLRPERWMEAELRQRIAELLPVLRGDPVYTQVPAFTTGDRGLLDMLALDRNGRLAVIELKADEDLHLPLQALDYWIRVRALNNDRQPGMGNEGGRALSAFERQGYFAGTEVSALPPRLLLIAPALRIHPANEPVLRYLSPQVEWELVALGEHWRRSLQVVFRKRSADPRV